MGLRSWILDRLCKAPGAGERIGSDSESVSDVVGFFRREFGPRFEQALSRARILDVGCGPGQEAVALATLGAARTYAIDVRSHMVRSCARELPEGQNIIVVQADAGSLPFKDGVFAGVVSRDGMEHFARPEAILEEVARVLGKNGLLWVTFGPLWYSPYGGHMQFMTGMPWMHLIFPERALMEKRRQYRNDGASRFGEADGGLNRMSLCRFLKLTKSARLRTLWLRVKPVRRLRPLLWVPGLRELFAHSITCVLVNE